MSKNWFDDHVEVIGLDDESNKVLKAALKRKFSAIDPEMCPCNMHLAEESGLCVHCQTDTKN